MNKADRLYTLFTSDLILFLTAAGIWGSSWLVIKFQIGSIDPIVSVFYRFLLSSAILFTFALFSKMNLNYSKKQHLFFFLQGSCNFSINYIITYWAELYAPSAMISMTFTLLVAFNIMGMKVFFKRNISPQVYLGTLLGIIGVGLIFKNEFHLSGLTSETIKGLSLGLVATLFASAGNMLAFRNHLHHIPVTIANTWGMFYGALTSLILGLVSQKSWAIPMTISYLSSLIYLSLFATVIAFGAYLTLVGRIGAEKAGYSTLISPMIAVSLSILFEGFKMTPYISMGLILCLLGIFTTNYSAAHRPKKEWWLSKFH